MQVLFRFLISGKNVLDFRFHEFLNKKCWAFAKNYWVSFWAQVLVDPMKTGLFLKNSVWSVTDLMGIEMHLFLLYLNQVRMQKVPKLKILSKKNIGFWVWRLPDFDPGGSRGRHYFINRIYLIRPNLDYCGERPANRSLTLHLHIQSARLWTVELYTLVTVSRVRLLLMPISFSMPHADLIL